MLKSWVTYFFVASCFPLLFDILIGLQEICSDLGMRFGERKLLFDPLSINNFASFPVGSLIITNGKPLTAFISEFVSP